MNRVLLIVIPAAIICCAIASSSLRHTGDVLMPCLESVAYDPRGDPNANMKLANDWSLAINADYQFSALSGLGAVGLGIFWIALIAWRIYDRFWRVRSPPSPGGFEVII